MSRAVLLLPFALVPLSSARAAEEVVVYSSVDEENAGKLPWINEVLRAPK